MTDPLHPLPPPPFPPLHPVLPADGYADGGEPYTTDELALMDEGHSDWIIDLYPADPRADDVHRGGWLDVIRGTREDAIEALEHYSGLIEATGHVPPSMQWQNGSGAAIIRRAGPLRYRVRVDCFEFETDAGYRNGFGWLVAREHPTV